jgi:signal transduction histidine kinase
MQTFQSARLKLTIWYALISMSITILFSLVIYAGLTRELNRIEHIQQLNKQKDIPFPPRNSTFRPPSELDVAQAKINILFTLLAVNGVVLAVCSGAGYVLAGRTLRPIKEMMDEQNRFITDASHELKTPLTTIRTEYEVAMLDKPIPAKEANSLINSSYEEIISLQGLAENLLELTTQQKKREHMQVEEVSLLEITETAFKKIIPFAKQKQITINSQIDDYILFGEQHSLTQLLVILLDNAIKYNPAYSKITLTSQKNDHYLLVKVSDNGVGIAQKDLKHIFDRFYRVDKSRSKMTGYGLGLSIAKEIVKAHNGLLSAESKLGEGTTFTIQLPRRRAKN